MLWIVAGQNRWWVMRIIIAAVVSGFAVAAQAQSLAPEGQSPSFHCSGVRYLDEKLICRDAGLAQLDNDLADAYRRLLLKLPGKDRAKLYQDEEAFVLARRRCGANRGCIEQQYRDRIVVLEWRSANTENR